MAAAPPRTVVIERADLQRLLDALQAAGYQVAGPTVRDGAVVYDTLTSVEQLPIGWTDVQDGGSYRLTRRGDHALFGYAVGPHSWKKYLFPPLARLWSAQREKPGGDFRIVEDDEPVPKLAWLGVRACELAALAVQDAVFMQGAYADPVYTARRRQLFLIVVQCGQAGGTCFCASMGTGPKASQGFDLALTELIDAQRHCFVVEIGSERGADLLRQVPHREAVPQELQAAGRCVAAAAQMGRTLDTAGLKELLYRNAEHSWWNDVAARCLTCANCTMVCPTCFCSTVEDTTDLTGDHAQRWRRWDSCFTTGFSYIHGGPVRASATSRYRQWMTHKLATWIDQFGTSGCVGCGRCITWCPVGIDITAEVRAIRESASQTVASGAASLKEHAHGDA